MDQTDQHTTPKLSMLYTLAGMFVLAVTDNSIPLISGEGSLWLFQATRTTLVIPILFVLTLMGIGTLRAKRPRWVIARNFFTATSMLIYFGCLAFLPIGVVVAGLLTSPIFVLVLTIALRGQSVGIWRWAAVAAGFTGALLVVWPPDGTITAITFLPILAGLFYAVGAIGTREWCEGENVMVMNAAFFGILGLYGVIGLVVLSYLQIEPAAGPEGWVTRAFMPYTPTMIWVTVVQAIGSIIGVGLLVRGYQLGEASYVAINEYSIIVFASFFGWLIWGQTLGLMALLGIALIVVAGSIIALRSK